MPDGRRLDFASRELAESALGREWDKIKHPRARGGRFAETFGLPASTRGDAVATTPPPFSPGRAGPGKDRPAGRRIIGRDGPTKGLAAYNAGPRSSPSEPSAGALAHDAGDPLQSDKDYPFFASPGRAHASVPSVTKKPDSKKADAERRAARDKTFAANVAAGNLGYLRSPGRASVPVSDSDARQLDSLYDQMTKASDPESDSYDLKRYRELKAKHDALRASVHGPPRRVASPGTDAEYPRSPGRARRDGVKPLTTKEFRTVASHSANPYIESARNERDGRHMRMPAANLGDTRDDIANTLETGRDQFGLPVPADEIPHLRSAMEKMTAELKRRGAE
jgi:hypothetical protein